MMTTTHRAAKVILMMKKLTRKNKKMLKITVQVSDHHSSELCFGFFYQVISLNISESVKNLWL